jgi:tRNA pseudouridine38-40 synthase
MSMYRYFIEVAYHGEGLSGFQIQDNAPTVQSAIVAAFQIFFKKEIEFTGSSRTDAGVHAHQNFFHFDWEGEFEQRVIYNLNALLPANITIKTIRRVRVGAHARFDALSRRYVYWVYRKKDPFLMDRGWYFPYEWDRDLLNEMADCILTKTNFEAFSKRNTQVKTYECRILKSYWRQEGEIIKYEVEGNRFLRGMVRGLVSSMLQVARGNKDLNWFYSLFAEGCQLQADFSAPAKGLHLEEVAYPVDIIA